MATPYLTFYDFDMLVGVFGPAILDGFQDGEGITIESEQSFVDKVGIDGKVTRSKVLNRTATITINLMQTSVVNDALSVINQADIAGHNGAGVFPIVLRDRNGRAVYEGAQCWIQQAPTVTYDAEATTRTWVLRVARLVRFDGGN